MTDRAEGRTEARGGRERTGALNAKLTALLDRHPVARLATADARGRPHVVPICFALAGRTLYTAIDTKPKRAAPLRLRRVRNILANPRVAIVVDRYSEDWTALGYVLLEGSARLVSGGIEHARAVRRLRRKYRQYRAMPLESRPVIAVVIERAVRWGSL